MFNRYEFLRLATPTKPKSPEPNSQIAAGTGTAVIDPEKLVDVTVVLVVKRSVSVVGLVNWKLAVLVPPPKLASATRSTFTPE